MANKNSCEKCGAQAAYPDVSYCNPCFIKLPARQDDILMRAGAGALDGPREPVGLIPSDDAASSVDHPPHYNAHPSGVECIDVIEHMSFNLGNAIKYIWRADEKGAPLEDLRKAAWYINREIEKRTK